jgi:hypothetical protein
MRIRRPFALHNRLDRIEAALEALTCELHQLRTPTLLPPPPLARWHDIQARLEEVRERLQLKIIMVEPLVESFREVLAMIDATIEALTAGVTAVHDLRHEDDDDDTPAA